MVKLTEKNWDEWGKSWKQRKLISWLDFLNEDLGEVFLSSEGCPVISEVHEGKTGFHASSVGKGLAVIGSFQLKGLHLNLSFLLYNEEVILYSPEFQNWSFTTWCSLVGWLCFMAYQPSFNAKSSLYVYIIYTYLPTPPLGQDMTQGQFLSEV